MAHLNPIIQKGSGLILLILAQLAIAMFFLADPVGDLIWPSTEPGEKDDVFGLEILAALTLLASVVFEIRYLLSLLNERVQMQRDIQMATGALHQLLEALYGEWQLTPAERDVAGFAIKGSSIAEIAEMRGSAQGTIKAHLNAIYRKAGVSGRPELVSMLIENLLDAPLLGETAQQSPA